MSRASSFRGWRIVGGLAVAQGCGIGLLNAYGLVVEPLAAEFGASVAVIGAGMSIFVLSMVVASAFLGPLLDRGFIRPTMIAGVLTMAGGITWLARADSLPELGAALAITSCGIAAYGPLPANVVLVNWFDRHRGTAIAIAAAGPPLVGFFVPGATAWLIEIDGWRLALTAIGWTLAAMALPMVAFVVVARPSDVGETVDGKPEPPPSLTEAPRDEPDSIASLLRAPDFWLIALGFGLYLGVPVGTGLFIVPLLLELEFSPWTAAFAATIAATANLVGTLGAGALADRLAPKTVLLWVLAIFIASLLTIGLAPSPYVVFAAIFPLTFCFGGGQPVLPLMVGRRFGTEIVGRALGITGPVGLPFLVAAAPLAGMLRDGSGTYRSVFLGGAAAVGIAAALLALVNVDRAATDTVSS